MSSDARPLAAGRPSSDEEETLAWTSSGKSGRRQACCYCGICCGSTVVVLGIIILILALTVFKVKEPTMNLNSVTIKNLNVGTRNSMNSPVAINLTAIVDMSVKNPNAVSFKFGGTSTSIYYKGTFISQVDGGPGTAGAHRTLRMNLTVNVMADQLMVGDTTQLLRDISSGSLPLQTSTMVGGRVKIIIFKKHVDIQMNCSITVSVSNMRVTDQSCSRRVWL